MNRLLSVALPLFFAFVDGPSGASVPRQPESWTQAGGIIRLSIILFFAAVVTGVLGYAKLPPVAAKAGKVLFAICLTVCIGLMLVAIFVPGNPAQP
jgi:hypothetical protein